jgi:inward rectifier potassium channel
MHTRLVRSIEIIRNDQYEVRVLGVPRARLHDIYHALLRVRWWAALAVIVGGWLVLNLLFAVLYLVTGGIASAGAGSFLDAFFFSVQTMGTIGYGAMYPTTRAANLVMSVESVTSLVVTALATGLVFVRFSQIRARVLFCRRVAVGPIDGVPTVMLRVSNERRGAIIDARFRLSVARTTRTEEGVIIYRSVDLALVRDRAAALSRSWMILHRIVPGSPLAGETPESLAAADAELLLSLTGFDDTALQPVHARYTWFANQVVFGARLADVLTEEGQRLTLDLTKFHDLSPTEPTESFPYPARGSASSAKS